MSMPAPNPAGGSFIPAPAAIKKVERDNWHGLNNTSLEVLKLAVEMNKGQTISAENLVEYAQKLYKWTTEYDAGESGP